MDNHNSESSIFTKNTSKVKTGTVLKFLSKDLEDVTVNSVVDLKHHRQSPNLGAEATKPKVQLITPNNIIYFKFGLTDNEICAELLAYHLAKQLEINATLTSLAWYKNTIGVASWSIGEYTEPDDSRSYSVTDYLHIKGFFEMCLFDYLIMNEDRHAGNWGIRDGEVAPLFDHNVSFGGEQSPVDKEIFMVGLTSPLDTGVEYHQQHDKILTLLYELDSAKVQKFLALLETVGEIDLPALKELYPKQYGIIVKLLQARVLYMFRRVGEFRGR